MAHFTGPLIHLSRSYTRNSTHITNILNDLRELPFQVLLCTLNINCLCTNILQNDCISPNKEILAIQREHELIHCSYILELLTVILMNNSFNFNEVHYHQVSGIAMDTILMPSYAIWPNLKDNIDTHPFPFHHLILQCSIALKPFRHS